MPTDMKALVLHGPDDLRLEQVPKPEAEPGSVVVQVLSAPLWDYLVRTLPTWCHNQWSRSILMRTTERSRRREAPVPSGVPAGVWNLLRRESHRSRTRRQGIAAREPGLLRLHCASQRCARGADRAG